ncbi:MAG: potassium transporter, partial [Parabacteroides sp.]|nr:potassium transporter [Parabacteroides sp.]
MDTRRLLFVYKIYAGTIQRLLTIFAELLILIASLGSVFTLIYQFGYNLTPYTTEKLANYQQYILLLFFLGISIRYIVKIKDIIKEKMLFADLSIYLILLAVLSSKMFFKRVMEESLPFLDFFSYDWTTYSLLIILTVIHSSRQLFTVLQHKVKPSLLFIFSFAFVILTGTGLLMLPNVTTGGINFIDALFTATSSVCVTGLTTIDIASTFTHPGHIIILILIQIGGIGVM